VVALAGSAALAAERGAAIRARGRLGHPAALRLHGCATAVVERHAGQVPLGLDELLALPGVGAYTARAVAAFAHRQRHPVVDTNVRRVVARAFVGLPEAGPATTVADLTAVEVLLPQEPEAAATASVAFMELGALVCTARAPRCGDCPLLGTCAWHAGGAPAPGATPGPDAGAGAGSRAGAGAGSRAAEGAGRRRSQRFIGTDRHVRGLIMAVLREVDGPVPGQRIDALWADQVQRGRALGGLLSDGLVCKIDVDRYELPR
jgi:A/G-specific adenine glycosylase